MWNPILSVTQAIGVPDYVTYLVILCIALYIYGTWTFSFFKEKGLKGPRPLPFLGNFLSLANFDEDGKMVKEFGKTYGLFMGRNPCHMITDPEMIKEITVKNFASFVNHDNQSFPVMGDMEKGLSVVADQEWKMLRSVISPTFTSGKLKKMVPIISDCADRHVQKVDSFVQRNEEFEMKDLAGNFTMDAIAETFFGVKIDSSANADDQENIFAKHAKIVFSSFDFSSPKMILLAIMPQLNPVFEKLGWGIFGGESMTFFRNNIFHILDMRKDMKNPPIDFLQLMLDAHKDDQHQDKTDKTQISIHDTSDQNQDQLDNWKLEKRALTKQEILGNALIFLLAGYETTATTIGWAIYNLVLNQEAQELLYEEISVALEETEGELTYDCIAKMSYLDQVINETLRLFPPAPRTDRVCNKDCKVGDVELKKGNILFISMYAIHHSAEYWDEPEAFRPERFAPENKHRIVPYSFMPFGVGPRGCVGMRLAYLELKIDLVKLIHAFKFVRSENTQVPIKFKMTGFVSAKDGIKVRAERR